MINTHLPAGLERRREDYPLITGNGHYVDDLRPPDGRPAALHMAVARSPYAHAVVKQIGLDAALALPGVVGAFAGAELVNGMRGIDAMMLPGLKKPERRLMAVDRVRYVGDPVAVVLAESRYIAEDALNLLEIDYEPLPAVSDPEAALAEDAPLLYEEFGSNVAFVAPAGGGDIQAAFDQADHIVRLRLVNQRLAPSSLENRACLLDFDPKSGILSAWLSSQALFRARETFAGFLGIDRSRIRVYNADVGGGFGAKTTFLGEEILAASLAVRYERPVKWIEGRRENLQAQTQGRGQINYIEAACQNDGRLLGVKVRTIGDMGAFLFGMGAMIPNGTVHLLSGPYQIQAVDGKIAGVFTNKAPTAPYRGAGRPEATYILERVMDRIAHELGLDPIAVRRRNFIAPDAFPYRTATGLQYESGNYQAGLDRLVALADYDQWRSKQRERRAAGSPLLLGLGLSTFIENAGGAMNVPGMPQEAATVRIRRDGTILVQSGVAHNGQGHFTAFAQIAAEVFHVSGGQVEVQMNDAGLPAFSIGTFGSRVTQTGGSAVLLAAEAAREKALLVASQVLEAAPADLLLDKGQVQVRGVPTRSVTLGELARLVEEQPDLIEHEPPNPANHRPIEGLAAWRDFSPPDQTYSSGAHLAVVEIDSDTGEARLLRYVAVDDCGRVLNHYLVEAQIHGSLAQGIGQALFEEVVYDEQGQLLSGSLMDYALPGIGQIPEFVTDLLETPSPRNPLGVKGVGEGGTIAAPPAVVNAVLDALAPLGIKSIDMPLKPEKIWSLIQAARAGTLEQPDPAAPAIFAQTQPSEPEGTLSFE
ncbi:MAG TPA: xanthine dehydrogenase family protein molybdopterin-binding subunit [Ktedonobacterales bacterium]|nr:xanthine dehydrogenase family protein molybdopterin-binding subunit [Ktedonobacterales bacterium]